MEIVQKEQVTTKGKGTKSLRGAMNRSGGAMKTLFTKRKKVLILSTMFALLCVTGYLNFTLNNRVQIDEPINATEANLFASFRTTRADERARDIMVYENIVATTQDATIKRNAELKLLEIRFNVEFENATEFDIRASEQYDDIIVNRTNGFVNVLIKKDDNITREQAIKILSILQSRDAELDIDNVYISIVE